MRRKRTAGIALTVLSAFLLSGCSIELPNFGRQTGDLAEEVIVYDGMDTENPIETETANTGIDANDPEVDLLSSLTDGQFYVVHDGVYYPTSFGSEINNSGRTQLLYSVSDETNIPTLFLEDGDSLIYYTTSGVVDYFSWTRYKDFGYTTGIYNVQRTTSNRYYILLQTEDSDSDSVVCISPLSGIYNDIYNEIFNGNLYLRKIGNIDLADNLFEHGLFSGWQKNEYHDLEVYDGTYYHHYILTADVHAFQPFESFASIEYTPSDTLNYIYNVEIPDYFKDGYYQIGTIKTDGSYSPGMVRIIKGKSFQNTPETFNEQILFPCQTQLMSEEELASYEAKMDAESRTKEITYYNEDAVYGTYSTYEPLNSYTTDVIGSLGYKTEDFGLTVEIEASEETKQELKDASIKKFPIYFPADRECTVTVAPSHPEASGDIYFVVVGDKIAPVTYDRFNNIYQYTTTGDGGTYYLYVSGLWHSYDINLINASSGKASDVTTTVIDFEPKKSGNKKSLFDALVPFLSGSDSSEAGSETSTTEEDTSTEAPNTEVPEEPLPTEETTETTDTETTAQEG